MSNIKLNLQKNLFIYGYDNEFSQVILNLGHL